MARPRRRARSSHPGIYIVPRTLPGGATSFRAKWKDPDTGLWTWDTLDDLSYPNLESREFWAERKSGELKRRNEALSQGSPKTGKLLLKEAVAQYLDSCAAEMRPRTVVGYRMSLGFLERWAEPVGVKFTTDLTPQTFVRFREALKAGKAMAPRRAATRRSPAKDRPPSPVYVNNTLRALGTFAGWLRRMNYSPLLRRDEVAEAIVALKTPKPMPDPLRQAGCKKLLEAALRHDAATFKVTRVEHSAAPSTAAVHRTSRHEPIAPFTAFMLLSGCRLSEALGLRWADVTLDAPDMDGNPAGEFRLRAEDVKTHRERRVDLAVSPALRVLLASMKLKAGDAKYVFGGDKPCSVEVVQRARRRLMKDYGAPPFTWQKLRQTAESFLVNAPSIYGSASIYLAAQQVGHAPGVADRHYLKIIRGIPRSARTLEDAMKVGTVLRRLSDSLRGHTSEAPTRALKLRKGIA